MMNGVKKMSKEVGRRIRALRRLKRFTQKDLAQRLKISMSMLSNIERGVQGARPEMLHEISQILGVSPEEFFLMPVNLKKFSLIK